MTQYIVLIGEQDTNLDEYRVFGVFKTAELAQAFVESIDEDAYNDLDTHVMEIEDYKKAILEKTIQLVQADD